MADWLKWSAATVALVGTLWGGFTAFDGRYARAADMRQQVDGLKALYLQQQVTALEREEFELAREAQRRRLSAFEDQRLNAVRKQLDYLRPQLKMVAP
jgi:hypothetical protein